MARSIFGNTFCLLIGLPKVVGAHFIRSTKEQLFIIAPFAPPADFFWDDLLNFWTHQSAAANARKFRGDNIITTEGGRVHQFPQLPANLDTAFPPGRGVPGKFRLRGTGCPKVFRGRMQSSARWNGASYARDEDAMMTLITHLSTMFTAVAMAGVWRVFPLYSFKTNCCSQRNGTRMVDGFSLSRATLIVMM